MTTRSIILTIVIVIGVLILAGLLGSAFSTGLTGFSGGG